MLNSKQYTPIRHDPDLREEVESTVKRGVALVFGMWVVSVLALGAFWFGIGYIVWHFLAKYW